MTRDPPPPHVHLKRRGEAVRGQPADLATRSGARNGSGSRGGPPAPWSRPGSA